MFIILAPGNQSKSPTPSIWPTHRISSMSDVACKIEKKKNTMKQEMSVCTHIGELEWGQPLLCAVSQYLLQAVVLPTYRAPNFKFSWFYYCCHCWLGWSMLYSPTCKFKSQSSNTLCSFQVCCLGNQPVSTPCKVEPNDVHPVLSHSACGLPSPTDPAPRVPCTPKWVCTRQNHFLGLTQAPGHILKTKSAAVRWTDTHARLCCAPCP